MWHTSRKTTNFFIIIQKESKTGVVYYQGCKSYASEVDTMGQITIRELGDMDFFREIPKDILQNLLNESKIVSYKKKEVIFHSRSRTKTVYFVYSGEVMLYNLTKHGNRKVIFIRCRYWKLQKNHSFILWSRVMIWQELFWENMKEISGEWAIS